MNTMFGLLVGTILFAAVVLQAQQKFSTAGARIAYAQKNMIVGLHSDNPGVVESTMMIVAKMKMIYLFVKIPVILSVIDSIATAHTSASLRYKAFLVANICADPAWFAQKHILETSETDLFYNSAAKHLQHKMLGMYSL
ncbi:MAG: hypothetical protein M0R68_14980 [Bacteroidetes bacterium]|nr:hypothetical protein [Bacteroidota bacterium]